MIWFIANYFGIQPSSGVTGSGCGKVGRWNTIGNTKRAFASNAEPMLNQAQICSLHYTSDKRVFFLWNGHVRHGMVLTAIFGKDFFSGCSWKYIAWVVQSPLYKSWNVSQYWLFISGNFTPQGRGPYTESFQQFYVLGDVPTEVHSVRRLWVHPQTDHQAVLWCGTVSQPQRTLHYTQDIRSPLMLTVLLPPNLAVNGVNSVPSVPCFGCFPGSFSDRVTWHKDSDIYADPCNLAQALQLIQRWRGEKGRDKILTYMLTHVIWLKSYNSSSAEEEKKEGISSLALAQVLNTIDPKRKRGNE